jgi:hypothetical protein
MSAIRSDRAVGARTSVQKAALVVGFIFLAVGVAGFVPGVTTDYDSLTIASHHSQALLLGLFQVSILHNIVHLLFGVAGVVAARTFAGSRGYLIIGGAVYLVLFVYGLIVTQDAAANFVPVNPADDILHLVLGAGMISLGMVLSRRAAATHRNTQEA